MVIYWGTSHFSPTGGQSINTNVRDQHHHRLYLFIYPFIYELDDGYLLGHFTLIVNWRMIDQHRRAWPAPSTSPIVHLQSWRLIFISVPHHWSQRPSEHFQYICNLWIRLPLLPPCNIIAISISSLVLDVAPPIPSTIMVYQLLWFECNFQMVSAEWYPLQLNLGRVPLSDIHQMEEKRGEVIWFLNLFQHWNSNLLISFLRSIEISLWNIGHPHWFVVTLALH